MGGGGGVSIQDAISVHSGTHGLLIGAVFESIWSRDPGKGGWNAVNRTLGLSLTYECIFGSRDSLIIFIVWWLPYVKPAMYGA